MEITDKEKEILLFAARKSIESVFANEELERTEFKKYPNLNLHLGAFVTLRVENKLRGCIGYIRANKALFKTVCNAAKQSAFSDPRFMPLTYEELEETQIEISVLSPLTKIDSYKQIVIGKHGLLIDDENIKAVLLPQVATANNYNRDMFLSALCDKAGLPDDYWKHYKLNLMVFTADIFSEDEMRNKEYETN